MSEDGTVPSGIKLHTRSRELELNYPGGDSYRLSCAYLRVYSPSAEVRGHGAGQETLQTGKLKVAISEIKPVGNYALQLVFDDGHDTGIYAWDYLYHLCVDRENLWQDYLDKIAQAGANRDPDVQVLHFDP